MIINLEQISPRLWKFDLSTSSSTMKNALISLFNLISEAVGHIYKLTFNVKIGPEHKKMGKYRLIMAQPNVLTSTVSEQQ